MGCRAGDSSCIREVDESASVEEAVVSLRQGTHPEVGAITRSIRSIFPSGAAPASQIRWTHYVVSR